MTKRERKKEEEKKQLTNPPSPWLWHMMLLSPSRSPSRPGMRMMSRRRLRRQRDL